MHKTTSLFSSLWLDGLCSKDDCNTSHQPLCHLWNQALCSAQIQWSPAYNTHWNRETMIMNFESWFDTLGWSILMTEYSHNCNILKIPIFLLQFNGIWLFKWQLADKFCKVLWDIVKSSSFLQFSFEQFMNLTQIQHVYWSSYINWADLNKIHTPHWKIQDILWNDFCQSFQQQSLFEGW